MAPGKLIEMLPLEDIEEYVKGIEQEKVEEAAKKKNRSDPRYGECCNLDKRA